LDSPYPRSAKTIEVFDDKQAGLKSGGNGGPEKGARQLGLVIGPAAVKGVELAALMFSNSIFA
jgi:hypothetical protein